CSSAASASSMTFASAIAASAVEKRAHDAIHRRAARTFHEDIDARVHTRAERRDQTLLISEMFGAIAKRARRLARQFAHGEEARNAATLRQRTAVGVQLR